MITSQGHLSRSFPSNSKGTDLISWSKNGFIAYSTPIQGSKDNLYISYLENINGRSWQLSKPQSISIKLENNFLPELSLVSWSNSSTDLAISDIYGNFYILLAGIGLLDLGSKNINPETLPNNYPSYEITSYNHMEMIYRDIINQDDTSHVNPGATFVAFKWLNLEKPQIINKPATLNQETKKSYNYEVNQFQPHGVTHPISTKQACVSLRQNGQFTLYYQGEHKVEYHKLSIDLSDEVSVISKASIGFTNDKQIITTIFDSITKKILIYKITIDWGFLVDSAKRQKVDPHYHTPKEEQKKPTLSVRKIHESELVQTNIFDDDNDNDGDEKMDIEIDQSLSKYKFGQLASIDLLSAFAEPSSELDIIISYSFENEFGQSISSLFRYNLIDESSLISDAFGELGLRKNITTTTTSTSTSPSTNKSKLVLKDKITRSGRIQSISTASAEYFMLIYYENGHIDVIDRTTMKIVNDKHIDSIDPPPNTICSIFDVGFRFPKVETKNPLILIASPNLTSFAYTEINGNSISLTLKVVEKEAHLGNSELELFISSVAFAFRHGYACYTNTCSDDIIALIQTELVRLSSIKIEDSTKSSSVISQTFIEKIITESHRAINFHLDGFSKDSVDKLLSSPPLQKLLSLQLVLGDLLTDNHIVSDIAWTVLNLRSTSFGIMFSLSSIFRQISKKKPSEDSLQDSITRGESIISLIGNFKWLIDLLVYINQELLQLAYSKNNPGNSKLNIHNSIALPLILSKVPRSFLIYALSTIGKTHEMLKKLHRELAEANKLFSPMKESLSRYFTICNNSPLTLNLFENYLRECDALISKEQSIRMAGKEEGYALMVEQKLVCQGQLTEDMERVGKILIDRHAVNINRDMKVSDLYFYDVDWLNIGIYRYEKKSDLISQQVIYSYPNLKDTICPRFQYSEKECIDVLRKVVISLSENSLKTIQTSNNSNNNKSKNNSNGNSNSNKLRKCTRCRAISLVSDPLVFGAPSTIGLWTMVFQRTCICGSAWVNVEV
ncbi:mediator of RNA polymerase II transcription subunit 16 [Scheffersomyces amazonensis]|uniref:mediator of RNA polymerase II transcription subunit 16 n=1 Tax=Scheffersomyces amazonensis TaxID=1078765 RepID=UPI00315D44C1